MIPPEETGGKPPPSSERQERAEDAGAPNDLNLTWIESRVGVECHGCLTGQRPAHGLPLARRRRLRDPRRALSNDSRRCSWRSASALRPAEVRVPLGGPEKPATRAGKLKGANAPAS